MYKDFEDFWENSGVTNADSYRCIAETYEFTKENVPQAFKSFARNCFGLAGIDGYHKGLSEGHKQKVESVKAVLNLVFDTIKNDPKLIDSCAKILQKYGILD